MAYLPPIDPLADQLFSLHMVQHLLITSVGVPLIIFGAPFFVLVRGIPNPLREKLVVSLVQNKKVQKLWHFFAHPLLALLLYEGVFWFWHIPQFYNSALRNDAIHLVEHACMAFAAMNLWRMIIDPHPMRSPLRLPLRIPLLGFMTTLEMALSAALTYSEKVWYAYDQLPLPSWWAWNRLQDQRLGGVIMWVPGGMVWVVAMGFVFYVWIQEQARTDICEKCG
jgi:cytochrome c oxidase assembly factor CtaG